MHYRLYVPGDFVALYAIEEECFAAPVRFSRSYLRRIISHPNTATWIAEEARGLCGFGLVQWTQTRTGMLAYIQTIEVLPEFRGRGVGGELLRRMEESAIAERATAIWLHVEEANEAAIRVYRACAYQLEGREVDYYGQGRAGLLYAKPLAT